MKLLAYSLILICIVACAPQDVPIASRSAQFDTYPQRLFESFENSCTGPGESFEKTGNQKFECYEILPAKASAFLILNYDGNPQDLPQSVTRLTSTKNTAGYRVDANVFFEVPQKDGSVIEVPLESPTLDQSISGLFQAMGGLPS
ncbi:hypothetical protein GS624_03360 [Ruegeria sp. HKCCD5849]|uniref:hypothetical protein n=1 Tax=unclassified Ruegeria TaxID=2625375 RepID=UPI001490E977|nr:MULTISPECIES: hypothetical protein [unclassified Ruegeria]NOD46344.1 hypothetical protein [Ruegeria sp. HKCCD5849]NOD50356.1 hypothetical protein [Ruegeria sp. HKCCD5851]